LTHESTMVARQLHGPARLIANTLISPRQSLDLRGGRMGGDVDEILLRFERGHSRDRPNLGIAQLSSAKQRIHARQNPQRTRDSNLLSRSLDADADPPTQPLCA
jgi:hypothetical protein